MNTSTKIAPPHRVAANKVMVSATEIRLNSYVERDSTGCVTKVSPLDETGHEVAMTAFYNGVITPMVSSHALEGVSTLYGLMAQPTTPKLDQTYQGKLLLWQSIDLNTLSITPRTQMTEL